MPCHGTPSQPATQNATWNQSSRSQLRNATRTNPHRPNCAFSADDRLHDPRFFTNERFDWMKRSAMTYGILIVTRRALERHHRERSQSTRPGLQTIFPSGCNPFSSSLSSLRDHNFALQQSSVFLSIQVVRYTHNSDSSAHTVPTCTTYLSPSQTT